MNRQDALARLRREKFDVLVIGGGATGLGCALDAASRGYATAVIDAEDFAKCTSSRSTKLVHGGVRYLRAGNVALVREALVERARMRENAPDYVGELPFFVPSAHPLERAYYAAGLKLYDALAGNAFPHSRIVHGGVVYWDGQFDDARFAIALARTAHAYGAAAANYVRAQKLTYRDGRVSGVIAQDRETSEEFAISSRGVINATGIFADSLRLHDNKNAAPLLAYSRGSHIVVDAKAVESPSTALLVPKTPDGRVLFAIPWHDRVLIGTTDVPAAAPQLEPVPTNEEIAYIIATVNRYLIVPLQRRDISSAFAGLRPLIHRKASDTARLSREHHVEIAPSGLVTIAGGKWTTYRRMAQDAIDDCVRASGLPMAPCRTMRLRIQPDDAPANPDARIAHAARQEMARTVEDVLARRTGVLFRDAAAARSQAHATACALAAELGQGAAWIDRQTNDFVALAHAYDSCAAHEASSELPNRFW